MSNRRPLVNVAGAIKELPSGDYLIGFSPFTTVTTQTGNYTLTDADANTYIICNHASGLTITVPASLTAGFCVVLEQRGAGKITVAISGGNTLRNRSAHTKSAGQYCLICVTCPDTSNAVLTGDTGT